MQRLLQIYFNQHLDSVDNNFWWDLFKDFVLPILIAGLAAYIAYFIFVKETKRDKEKEERKKIEERSDKLLFFSTIIESCLTISIQQKNNIKDYIKLIRQNDVDFHFMTFVPLNDLERVSNVLNLETYLLAYVNKYSKNRKTSIKEFKEIMASIDFLLAVYKNISEQLKRVQMYDYERKTKLQNLFRNAYNLIGRLIMIFQQNHPDVFNSFIDIYENFVKNHPGNNYDVNFFYNYFFVPFNDFCAEYFAAGHQPIQELFDLALFTREGKQLYANIKSESQTLKGQLVRDFKLIYGAVLDLRSNSKKLLTEI